MLDVIKMEVKKLCDDFFAKITNFDLYSENNQTVYIEEYMELTVCEFLSNVFINTFSGTRSIADVFYLFIESNLLGMESAIVAGMMEDFPYDTVINRGVYRDEINKLIYSDLGKEHLFHSLSFTQIKVKDAIKLTHHKKMLFDA